MVGLAFASTAAARFAWPAGVPRLSQLIHRAARRLLSRLAGRRSWLGAGAVPPLPTSSRPACGHSTAILMHSCAQSTSYSARIRSYCCIAGRTARHMHSSCNETTTKTLKVKKGDAVPQVASSSRTRAQRLSLPISRSLHAVRAACRHNKSSL